MTTHLATQGQEDDDDDDGDDNDGNRDEDDDKDDVDENEDNEEEDDDDNKDDDDDDDSGGGSGKRRTAASCMASEKQTIAADACSVARIAARAASSGPCTKQLISVPPRIVTRGTVVCRRSSGRPARSACSATNTSTLGGCAVISVSSFARSAASLTLRIVTLCPLFRACGLPGVIVVVCVVNVFVWARDVKKERERCGGDGEM
jgi:hypothetical protein